jgi:hypothetical protein
MTVDNFSFLNFSAFSEWWNQFIEQKFPPNKHYTQKPAQNLKEASKIDEWYLTHSNGRHYKGRTT